MGRPEQINSPFFRVHVSSGVLTCIHWIDASFFFSLPDGFVLLISFPNLTRGFWAWTEIAIAESIRHVNNNVSGRGEL
jgi:hypothetical protein